jgi:hypothetical protein
VLQFHGGRAQSCFSNARVPVDKMFDLQSVRVAQTPCEKLPLNKENYLIASHYFLDRPCIVCKSYELITDK